MKMRSWKVCHNEKRPQGTGALLVETEHLRFKKGRFLSHPIFSYLIAPMQMIEE